MEVQLAELRRAKAEALSQLVRVCVCDLLVIERVWTVPCWPFVSLLVSQDDLATSNAQLTSTQREMTELLVWSALLVVALSVIRCL